MNCKKPFSDASLILDDVARLECSVVELSKSVDWVKFSNAGLIDVVVNEEFVWFVIPKLAGSA